MSQNGSCCNKSYCWSTIGALAMLQPWLRGLHSSPPVSSSPLTISRPGAHPVSSQIKLFQCNQAISRSGTTGLLQNRLLRMCLPQPQEIC